MTEPSDDGLMTTASPEAGRGRDRSLRNWAKAVIGRRAFLTALLVLAVVFPLMDGNEGDIDAAANALATLALGLNIVVGFAGLLDLGYAAFFAIGAYAYGIFSSYQVQPEWWAFWEPTISPS
jgi:branched-chain amino acid transport system permease protein